MRESASIGTCIFLGALVASAGCGSSSTPPDTASLDSGAQNIDATTDDSGVGPGGGTDGGSGGGTDGGPGGGTEGGSGGGTDGGPGGGTDGGGDDAGSTTEAGAKFPFPVVSYQGGPLIAAPKIVTVTFPSDALASQLVTFGASVASSSYWDTVRAGYCTGASTNVCIGDGPPGTAVALTSAPALSYTDSAQGGASSLQTYIGGLITAGTLPAPDANTIYTFYFPPTTTITLDGQASCQVFEGYHNAFTSGAQTVYYSIIPECAASPQTPPITTLQNTTITASHEFMETASDGSATAFSYYLDLNNPATYGWDDVLGGEIGDLCVDFFGLAQDETTENGYTVQRIWSVANAAAGKNPCVPVPAGEVYFNAYSEYSVVVVDVGQSITINATALADGAMGSWHVDPQDWTDPSTQYLSFSLPGGSNSDAGSDIQVTSGETFQVTVKLVADPANAPFEEADAVLVSDNATSTTAATAAHLWPFIVITSAEAADAGISMGRPRAGGRRVSHGGGFAHRFPRSLH